MPTGPSPERPGWTPSGWTLVAASTLLAALLWARHTHTAAESAGLFHDGGVYLVTASALAADAGYRRVSQPGTPPEVRYPPLFPFFLSLVWRAAPRFPANLVLLKGVCLAAGIALALLLPGYLRAVGLLPAVAAAAAALTVLSPLTARYATAIASELPFALVSIMALWALEHAARSGRIRTAALAGLLAALAFLTRSIGAAVVAAGLLTLAWRGNRRQVAAYALAAALGSMPWALWVVLHGKAAGGLDYLSAWAADGPPAPLQVLRHLIELPAAIGIVTVPGLADVLPTEAPHAALVGVYVAGALALVAALRLPFGPYVALSLVAATAVPWFQPRFLVPLAPLFLAALLAALLPHHRGVRAVVLGALFLLALLGNSSRLARVEAAGIPALEQAALTGLRWDDVDDALAWIRTNTAPDDVLAAFHDPLLYLYTGRRAVQAYPALWRPAPAHVTAAIAGGGARYLIDIPCPETGPWAAARRAWREWIAAHEGALTTVYSGAAGRIRIWRIDGRLAT